jgi:hypothetical protein
MADRGGRQSCPPVAFHRMNLKFVARSLLLAFPLAILISAVWVLFQTPLVRAPDPTPLPPTIVVPRGAMPAGPVGLRELARYQGEDYRQVGSGFLLLLDSGEIVAVTTAHSLAFCDGDHRLERIALGVVGRTGFVGELDTLRGLPGRPLTIEDLTLDYVLLHAGQPIEQELLLHADARGAPQPGERVSLFEGVKGRVLEGTVQSTTDQAVWVLMDDWFSPGQMSGSPFVSQHTGQVVGMAVAATPRRNRLLLGAHPIGSIVHLAESATRFPSLSELCK